MNNPIAGILTMNSRGVLARELRELGIGEVLLVPFKHCSMSNIKKTMSVLNSQNFTFEYDNSGTENSVIRRTK